MPSFKFVQLDSIPRGRNVAGLDELAQGSRRPMQNSNVSQDTLVLSETGTQGSSLRSCPSESTLGGLDSPKTQSTGGPSLPGRGVPFDLAALRVQATNNAIHTIQGRSEDLNRSYQSHGDSEKPSLDNHRMGLSTPMYFERAFTLLKEAYDNRLSIPTPTTLLLLDICWKSTLNVLTRAIREASCSKGDSKIWNGLYLRDLINSVPSATHRQIKEVVGPEMALLGLECAFRFAAQHGQIAIFNALEQIVDAHEAEHRSMNPQISLKS